MKILHIDTELTWRGGENQIRLLAEGALARGFSQHLLIAPRGSEIAKRLSKSCKVYEISIRSALDPFAVYQILQICKKENVSILDAHTSHAHTLGLLVKTLLPKICLVVHRRVDFVPSSHFFNRRKYLSQKVSGYVAISKAIAEILLRYGVPASKIQTIPSAVNDSVYSNLENSREKLAQSFNLSPEIPIICNASALTKQKGYYTLLRALGILKVKHQQNFFCIIAGDGLLRKELETLRDQLSLTQNVIFLGWIKDVPSLLSGADILALSSQTEGLGTIVLDAIYAGCSVVATRAGGIPEMIEHMKTGYLSPVGDPEAFALNLLHALTHKEHRLQMSAAARLHVQKNFSLERMVLKNLENYKNLLPVNPILPKTDIGNS